MVTHMWGDENVDWDGINEAAEEIGQYLAKWGRIHIMQTKEKFGTVRVYCTIGFSTIHSLIFPYHHWIHRWWPHKIDSRISAYIGSIVDKVLIPYHKWIYKKAYKKAVLKRPHLYHEIVCIADYGELLEGYVPGYKHDNYWGKIKEK